MESINFINPLVFLAIIILAAGFAAAYVVLAKFNKGNKN